MTRSNQAQESATLAGFIAVAVPIEAQRVKIYLAEER